ncbi:MAG: right-handed parallel beta-helix repeat-containing protein, partial [Calditrichaeota bacterium]|nr:right-handed parallel beta-helix repeat-containing protein [Calditrichota bacterium]
MKKIHSYIRLFLIAVVFLAFSQSSFASLNVQGTLSGGTWSSDDSPIIVNGDLFLPGDAALVIDSGVRVVFTGPYNFVVEGSLQAVGTKNDSIVFTGENPAIDSLRWRGLRFINSQPDCKLSFCTIEYSWARGQWPENCGGGIFINGTSPDVTRCTIKHNDAEGDGGGVYAMFTTSIFRNNLVILNQCNDFGGGFFVSYAELSVSNCTIAMNTAGGWGGGVFVGAEGSPVIKNCIITLNVQDLWGDDDNRENDLPNHPFFADFARSSSSEPLVTFTCLPTSGDPFDGPGNISNRPEFVNVESEPFSFHLSYSSPCIDAGDPEMNPGTEPDILINRVNLGSYGGTEDAALSVPVISNSEWTNGTDIDFESIRTYATATEEITITNNGHYRLFLYDFAFTSPVFFVDSTFVDGVLTPSFAVEPIEAGESAKFALNFSPTELEDYLDTLIIISNDTLQAFPRLALLGTGIDPVAVIDSGLTFGERQIGKAHIDTLWVQNQGTSDLHISSVRVQGDGFTAEVLTDDVSPQASGRIRVIFRPVFPEEYDATISVSTNDRDIIVPLLGIGVGPKMEIEIETLFLGYVYADGDTAVYTVDITNEGDELLIIDEAEASLPEIFTAILPDGSLEIQPDSTVALSIRFHPNNPDEDYEDIIVISSNYPIDHSIELSGRGMAEPGNYVFGDVGGRIWDLCDEDEVYIVLDSVYVPAHEKLKIMPGARILFEPGAFMQVDGELRAIGLPDDSIRFIPRGDTTHWNGLYLAFDDATTMSYCIIRGSSNGGMSIREASPQIQFCTVTDNFTETEEKGGGIYIENSGARIIGCEVSYNSSPSCGGIYILNSKPVINNCIIKYNTGDGVYMRFQASALMQNNLIYGNDGNGVSVSDYSSPHIINNAIVNNRGNGIQGEVQSVPQLRNSIFYYNDGTILLDESSNVLVSYCDVEGGFGETTNNLDVDPLFVDPAQTDDYHLTDNSPLIDKGNPENVYRDHSFPPSLGTYRNDIGAYGGPLGGNWETPEVSISAFQNPAFKQWIDIFVTSLEPFGEAPVCSLELGNIATSSIQLNQSPADSFTYMGSYEANQGGSLYIMVDAIVNGTALRVSRAYEFNLVGPEGGTVQMVGVSGHLTLTPEANNKSLAIITGCKFEPLKPTDRKIFLSSLLFIMGMDDALEEFVELRIDLDLANWSDSDLRKIGIYRYENGRWTRLKGGYTGGVITGKLDHGGHFAVALDDLYDPESSVVLPNTARLLRAYPNPFNQEVKIEFLISRSAHVQLDVYDLAGRRVAELVNSNLS